MKRSMQQVPRCRNNPRLVKLLRPAARNWPRDKPDLDKSKSADKGGVQPEEILSQIKALTENGLYSVRFENSQEFNELVVKVVDTETDEVIRQIPAEEVLGVRAVLDDLRGKIVNTVR